MKELYRIFDEEKNKLMSDFSFDNKMEAKKKRDEMNKGVKGPSITPKKSKKDGSFTTTSINVEEEKVPLRYTIARGNDHRLGFSRR